MKLKILLHTFNSIMGVTEEQVSGLGDRPTEINLTCEI